MLPIEFAALEGKVAFSRQITSNEFHGSCPNCGGEIHQDGSLPDRFIMWIFSRRGTPFGLCRRCSYKWTPDKADAQWTEEERAEFRRKYEELERVYWENKSKELDTLVDTIQKQNLHKKYFEEGQAHPEIVKYYESIGIPKMWQEYLVLGYMKSYKVRGELSAYEDSAYTFPIWSGGRVENIKLRVANPKSTNDRYRNMYRSGCQHLYTPIHESDKIGNKVIVMEGEKKAISAQVWGELPDCYQIVGVQSAMPEKRILKLLSEAEVVYLAFDPDAYTRNEKTGKVPVLSVASQIGEKKCRLVVPPKGTKFDDAILLGYKFANAINMAIKPERLGVR